MSEDNQWKTYQFTYGVGTPKWFHMQDYYYKSKDERILVRVDPRLSTCFSTKFFAQLWVGKRKRTLVAEFKGENESLITITTKSGISGLALFNWYKKRLNLINANNVIKVGDEIKDRFGVSTKESRSKVKGRK